MKKNLASIVLVCLISLVGYSQVNSDCQKTCKVSKLIEQDVLLGVQINNGPGCMNAIIVRVVEKSAAEKLGLKIGNIITKVNNTEIRNSSHLVEVIQTYKPGDKVNLTYYTEDKLNTKKVRLGAKKTTIVEEEICCDEVNNNLVISDGLTVYPNPASDFITLKTNSVLEGEIEIMIYNLEGKEIYFDSMEQKGLFNQTVDIKYIQNGDYIVRVSNSKSNYSSKFIVNR